jgi:hypothetical protein
MARPDHKTIGSKADVDQDNISSFSILFELGLFVSLLFELGFFVSLLFGLVFFRRLLN